MQRVGHFDIPVKANNSNPTLSKVSPPVKQNNAPSSSETEWMKATSRRKEVNVLIILSLHNAPIYVLINACNRIDSWTVVFYSV